MQPLWGWHGGRRPTIRRIDPWVAGGGAQRPHRKSEKKLFDSERIVMKYLSDTKSRIAPCPVESLRSATGYLSEMSSGQAKRKNEVLWGEVESLRYATGYFSGMSFGHLAGKGKKERHGVVPCLSGGRPPGRPYVRGRRGRPIFCAMNNYCCFPFMMPSMA